MLGPSLEPSQRDGSNDGHKYVFYGKIWIIIPKLSLLPFLIWSTAANSSREKPKITEGVLCTVENICL